VNFHIQQIKLEKKKKKIPQIEAYFRENFLLTVKPVITCNAACPVH